MPLLRQARCRSPSEERANCGLRSWRRVSRVRVCGGRPSPRTGDQAYKGNTYSRITVVQPQEYEYAYSAWCTLYITCMRAYSKALYSHNGLHRNRIRVVCVSSLRVFPPTGDQMYRCRSTGVDGCFLHACRTRRIYHRVFQRFGILRNFCAGVRTDLG